MPTGDSAMFNRMKEETIRGRPFSVGAYTTRADHEWFHIPRHGHLIACCDCGLVHLFKSRVRNRRVEVKAVRMPKHTGGRRSGLKRVNR